MYFLNSISGHWIPSSVTQWSFNAFLFGELSWGLPLCVFALIVYPSVRLASGVQCWSCSQPSSSPSLSVLAGQKHCLIRHWGRWPPPVFFFCKTSQSLGSTPPLVRRSGLSAAFFWIFFLLHSSVEKVPASQSANVTHFSVSMFCLVFQFFCSCL